MKRQFMNDVSLIKYEVLCEVAKLAYAGELKEKQDQIPYTIFPGNKPRYRCCVYREREVTRQRVNLAEGRTALPGGNMKNIVQVLPAACEGCPINRFSVTNNCQMCMMTSCLKACKFGAITFEGGHANINPAKCRECGQCAKACPYNAIADLVRPCKRACPVDAISMDEDMIVVIDDKKCISCGQCIIGCPFGAISDRSFIVDVIRLMRSGAPVYAMVAPAIEGQFGADVSIGMLRESMKALGFTDMYEVSLGADFVSQAESDELLERHNAGEKMTTSCCPAFVNMIKKHYPELAGNISTTVSPMQATAKLIKAIHPEAICVFIGPCIAKKGEVIDNIIMGGADYALTYEEIYAMMSAKEVDPSDYTGDLQQGSKYGKNYSVSGGVTAAVIRAFKEKNADVTLKICKANGAQECKKALLLMKNGRLPEDFIEGMACEGGCVSGPAMLNRERTFMKDRNAQINTADDRGILDNLSQYEQYQIKMHKH